MMLPSLVQVTESISGSVVPLAMFNLLLCQKSEKIDLKESGMKGEVVVLYLHALDSNGNKRAECNFENNS